MAGLKYGGNAYQHHPELRLQELRIYFTVAWSGANKLTDAVATVVDMITAEGGVFAQVLTMRTSCFQKGVVEPPRSDVLPMAKQGHAGTEEKTTEHRLGPEGEKNPKSGSCK